MKGNAKIKYISEFDHKGFDNSQWKEI